MTTTHRVAITGATGHIGKPLAEELLRRGLRVRAIGRSPQKLVALADLGAELQVGDLDDSAFLARAFRGAHAAFVMTPPHVTALDQRAAQRRTVKSLLSALQDARVERVVLLSSIGAGLSSGTGPILALHELEEALRQRTGVATVALRPTFFMENLQGSIPLIRSAGINGSPARPDLSLPMIATRDIAAAAADILAQANFTGYSVHDLLGPRDYTQQEATSILGTAIGKPGLPYVQFKNEDFKHGLVGAGLSESVADSYVEMYEAMNRGTIQETVKRTLSNTTPTTLETFAREVFAPAFAATQ
jgi:uncharacterized protein YbjT (DUF2867 family)